jgi:hypothetical protein
MKRFPYVEWLVPDVFRAYTTKACYDVDPLSLRVLTVSQCGGLGCNLFWFSVPVRRLCDGCLSETPDGKLVDSKLLINHFKLEDELVKYFPTWRVPVYVRTHPRTLPFRRLNGFLIDRHERDNAKGRQRSGVADVC